LGIFEQISSKKYPHCAAGIYVTVHLFLSQMGDGKRTQKEPNYRAAPSATPAHTPYKERS
jgi:hypothetical protein